MLNAEFIEIHGREHSDIPQISLNKHTVLGEPSSIVLVKIDCVPSLVVNIFADDECHCFSDIKIAERHVIVGLGEHIHIVDPIAKEAKSINLQSYFGYIYPIMDLNAKTFNGDFLVSSACQLHLFDNRGAEKWVSASLGIDGVMVNKIDENTIYGSGEWDPPGGWRSFAISLDNGG